jgi:predicted choloylglycine hydrolase
MPRVAHQNTKKNDMPAPQLISKMKGFASELATTSKKIDDDEMKGYIFNGLDDDYNLLVASTNAAPTHTLTYMCVQLTSFDYRQRMVTEAG